MLVVVMADVGGGVVGVDGWVRGGGGAGKGVAMEMRTQRGAEQLHPHLRTA